MGAMRLRAAARTAPLADAALVAATLVWGSTFIVNARVIRDEPPMAYLAVRFLLGSLLLFALSGGAREPLGKIARDATVLGVLLAIGMATQIAGQTETSASKAAFLTGLSVALTPIFAIFRTRRLPDAASLAAVCLACIGFALLSWPTSGGSVNRGDLMVVVCAVAFALYIVENAERAPRYPALRFAAWQIAVAGAVLAAISVVLRRGVLDLPAARLEARPLDFDPSFTLAIAYMTLFATVGTFAAQTWAQTKMSATRAAVFFALEPVWAALLAAWFLSERIGPRGYAGGAFVVAGILASEARGA
jgi:drug/metabolite transporter (DMT)-like permease